MKKLSKKEFEKIYIAEFYNGRSSEEALNQIEQENGFTHQRVNEGIQATTANKE